jgi:hypothetical protein
LQQQLTPNSFREMIVSALKKGLLAVSVLGSTALAQRWDTEVDGADTCRPIWREYGRTMSGRASAVFCEIRDVGVVAPRSTIDVEGHEHSGVRIVGAQRRDMRVRLVIQAQGETVDDARNLAREVTIDLAGALLRPDVPYIRDNRRSGRRFVVATLLLDVPMESNINASVRHGPMDIENVRGKLDLSAEHGPLTIRDVAGDVRARSRHGPLSVDLSATRWEGAGLDALAQHGPMTLRVPNNFNADLEIGAEHGPLQVDIPLTLTRFDRSLIQTKMGAGGPRIRALAEHGPMSLRTSRP